MSKYKDKVQKYYVVWEGRIKGIFLSWADCNKQIAGWNGARYKSFTNPSMAIKALGTPKPMTKKGNTKNIKFKLDTIPQKGICVDGAYSNKTGLMEWRAVLLPNKEEIFRFSHTCGTNNIAEFLAIVDAFRWCQEKNTPLQIYSDSVTAICWAKIKLCRTKISDEDSDEELFSLIADAEHWLKNNPTPCVSKWATKIHGENLADFGNK